MFFQLQSAFYEIYSYVKFFDPAARFQLTSVQLAEITMFIYHFNWFTPTVMFQINGFSFKINLRGKRMNNLSCGNTVFTILVI